MANIVDGRGVTTTFLGTSIDFSGYSAGSTVVGQLDFGEPRALRAIGLSGDETTNFANGTNSLVYFEALGAPGEDKWMGFDRLQFNNSETTGGFNGFTWTEFSAINTRGQVLAMPWNDADATDAPVIAWGVRFRVSIDAGDTTLAGVLANVWLSAVEY